MEFMVEDVLPSTQPLCLYVYLRISVFLFKDAHYAMANTSITDTLPEVQVWAGGRTVKNFQVYYILNVV